MEPVVADVVIVANDDLAPLARRLAHAFGQQKWHSAAFWTSQIYKANESRLKDKQAVIFIGENEFTESYIPALTKRFSAFGAACWTGNSKAVLITSQRNMVSPTDLATLRGEVKKNREEIRQKAATQLAGATSGPGIGTAILAEALAVVIFAPIPFTGWKVISSLLKRRKLKADYRKLQYEYALSRFLRDELEAYLRGLQEQFR
jgi:hypothetical protein